MRFIFSFRLCIAMLLLLMRLLNFSKVCFFFFASSHTIYFRCILVQMHSWMLNPLFCVLSDKLYNNLLDFRFFFSYFVKFHLSDYWSKSKAYGIFKIENCENSMHFHWHTYTYTHTCNEMNAVQYKVTFLFVFMEEEKQNNTIRKVELGDRKRKRKSY